MSDIAALGFEIDSTQARNAAKDLDRLTAAADKTERSAKKLSTASRDLLRDESGRFMSAAQAADKYGSEIEALRVKYNPLYAASKQFEAQQGELQRALALGAISVAQYDAALEGLQGGMVRSGGAVNQFGKSMQASSAHTTNLMFQFQDISMMLAAGQNPLMLAMQQGAQVAGVFKQMEGTGQSAFSAIKGGLLGLISPTSLLTIGVIAGGAALVQWGMSAMGAGDDARTLDDAMGDVSTAISDYSGYIATASMTTAELTEKFGAFSGEMREFSVFMAGITLGDALTAFNEQSTMLKDGLTGIEQGLANVAMAQEQLNSISKDQNPELWLAARDALELFQGNLDEAATKLGILPSQAQGLADVLSGIKSDGSMSDLANSSAAALRYISSITPNAMSIKGPLGDAYRAMYKVHENARQAAKSTQELAGSAPGGDWMNPAIGGVDALIGRVEAALGRVAALRSAAMSGLAAQYQQYGEGRVAGETRVKEADKFYGGTGNILTTIDPDYYKSEGGSGGGGGGANEMADRYKALEKGFASEMMLKMQQYTLDQETLKWALDTKKITLEQYKDEEEQMRILAFGSQMEQDAIKYQLEQDALQAALDQKLISQEMYNQQVAALRQQEMETTLGHYDSLFSNMATIAKAGGDKATGAVKAFSIAQGLINSYLAFTQVLADPSLVGRPFMRIALAGSTLAAGLAQVSAMGGGSGGGRSGSASATTSATAASRAEPERVTRVELQGEDWLVSLAETMMTQIYDASKNGRVIVARA